MSDSTPRLALPELGADDAQNHVVHNDALIQLDAIVDLYLLDQYVNTPPSSPADGDAYLTGGSPTGAWSGYAYKIATCVDGAWRFYTPFNGLRAWVATTSAFIVYAGGTWTDWNSLISASETSVASAATCDLGAAGALFVDITGTTTITSFGSGANKLRFIRFAGALTLTHNATSLFLPNNGGNIATAAGDTCVAQSDASGHWRVRDYCRASGAPLNGVSCYFSAYLGSTASNVTGDGTTATIICDTAVTNVGSAYNTSTGTFTAPADGLYAFSAGVRFTGLATSHTYGFSALTGSAASARFFEGNIGALYGTVSGVNVFQAGGATILKMTAGDTLQLQARASNGSKVVNLFGGQAFTNFSGYRIA